VDWVKLAVLFLQGVRWMINKAEAAQQFSAGRQAEVYEQLKALTLRTSQGRELYEKVARMNDAELDDLESDLASGRATGAS